MPTQIEVHALTYVPGETDRLTGPVAFDRSRSLGARAKRLRYLAAQRGDTPVAHDAARGPDNEPESTPDHRRAPALRPASGRTAAGGSSAAFTSWPDSAPGLGTVP